ncbi:TcaA 3rd/4th domain-containing protein [Gottfriedia acidiceleris]|uniref:TcaA 3rd/4th domain-containing protein n=1 Tax=Gottfriedia acidiceleris TaxID=371036 RepID=UPI002FFFE99D
METQLREQNSLSRAGIRTMGKERIPSFKRKWMFILIPIIAILITHLTLNYLNSPKRLVRIFDKAVSDNNYKEVTHMLQKGGTGASLDEDSVIAFMDYLNSYDVLDKLDDMIQNNKVIHSKLIDGRGNYVLSIKKGGKFLGIYQTYLISAQPFELKISSPIDDIELKLNNHITHLNKDEYETTYHKILPGKYTLAVSYKGVYSDVKDAVDIDFSSASKNKLSQELTFDVSYVQIYSNEPEAELFVNGKDTGQKVSELDRFGPFLLNGKTVVHAEIEKNGELFKTDDIPVTGRYVDLMFDTPVENQDETNQKDGFFAGLKRFFDKYLPSPKPSSDLEEKQLINGLFNQNGQAFLQSKEYQDKIKKKDTTQKLTSFSMKDSKQDDSGMIITTNESYEITDKHGKTKMKSFEITYHFSRENDELKMDRILEVKEIK